MDHTPHDEPSGGRDGSGAMFDRIARRYDLLNRLMSLGLDRGWRRRLIAALGPAVGDEGAIVLDVATGTADVALALARCRDKVAVVGLDSSAGMLALGQRKVLARNQQARVRLLAGDGQQLPFADHVFSACCIAFGIRNVPDRDRGLREMRRVTRPGGIVAVLELSEPRRGLLAPLTRWHVRRVVPRLGAWLSGSREYRYLQRSMEAFPPPEVFAEQMRAAGLQQVEVDTLGLGAVQLFRGVA